MTSLVDLAKASSTNAAAHQSRSRNEAWRSNSWPPERVLSTAAARNANHEQVAASYDPARRLQHQPEQSNTATNADTVNAPIAAVAAPRDSVAAAPSVEARVPSPAPSNPTELRSITPALHLRAHLTRKQVFDGPDDPRLAAYMCKTLGLVCAHRPQDLVFQPSAEGAAWRYISHAELWRLGQLVEAGEAVGWDDITGTESRMLEEAKEHRDSGWRHTVKKPKGTACDVCGKTEGWVYGQQKTEGRDIFVRVVCFRCVGMRDEETGNVKRRVKRTFSYEPGDIMPDELGEVPASTMARASSRELEASVAATNERLRRARKAEFMSFPRELTEAEAGNIGAGWARNPETPTVWVRV